MTIAEAMLESEGGRRGTARLPEKNRFRETRREDLDRHRVAVGRLSREAGGHRHGRLRRDRDLRDRFRRLRRQPARGGGDGARPWAGDLAVPAVSRFRGHAGRGAVARLRPGGAEVRSDGRTWRRSGAGLFERRGRGDGGDRPGRRRFLRTGRTGSAARHSDRLRGAGLGPARQRPSRRLGGGATGGSCQCRPDPRQLPHAGAKDRPRHHPPHPGRPHLLRATRGCAEDRHGPALLVAALPQHAGAGRSGRDGFHAGGGGDRL